MKETENSMILTFYTKRKTKNMTVSFSSSFFGKDYFQIKKKNKLLFSDFLDWLVFRDAK